MAPQTFTCFSSSKVLLVICLVAAFARSSSSQSSDTAVIALVVDVNSGAEVAHSKWEYPKRWSGISSPWSFAGVLGDELEGCEEIYGIFPCSTTIGGNLFLLVLYGYLLLRAAGFLSEGSELLLTVLNPGLIGGLLLPMLGALPSASLILVSGLSASADEAQSQVLVGMGLVAGSSIFLLTLVWGSALLVGRCDLVVQRGHHVAKDRTLTKGWSLTGTGITTDQQTRVASWIMTLTVIPFLVAQTPVVFNFSKETGSIFVLVACVISVIGLASYCTYQVSFPWIQQRWIYMAKLKLHRSKALHRISQFSEEKSWGNLHETDGVTPNKKVLEQLFHHFDEDKNGTLSVWELNALITSLGIEHDGKIPQEEQVKTWMNEFDISRDGLISVDEFVEGMVKWMRDFRKVSKTIRSPSIMKRFEAPSVTNGSSKAPPTPGRADPQPHIFWSHHSMDAQSDLANLLQDQEEDDEHDHPPSDEQVTVKAIAYLMTGAFIAAVVADPLVGAVGNFSAVTGIPSFFISFVGTAMATNISEATSSLVFARRKKKKNISMTYSQIYGGVTMNNTLCLAIFLAIVYSRGLTWDFSSEVVVIVLAILSIGALASVRVTFPSWMAIIALLLYPFSISLVIVLDYVYHWQ